jgi:hypothetical protein
VEQRIMTLVAQRSAGGGAAPEGSSAMDALRAAKGKAKILVSEVRAAAAFCFVLHPLLSAVPAAPRRSPAPFATTVRRCA